ncbi:hypothetical protein [Streptomyces sp. NPDC001054]
MKARKRIAAAFSRRDERAEFGVASVVLAVLLAAVVLAVVALPLLPLLFQP